MLMVEQYRATGNKCRAIKFWRYDNVGGEGISSGFRNYGAWVEGPEAMLMYPEKSIFPVLVL